MNYFQRKLVYPLKAINFVISKRKKILFIPHENCRNDGYDIINFKSDNVLCLLNYILHSKKYNEYTCDLIIYDGSLIEKYKSHCEKINKDQRLNFILYSKVNIVRSLLTSSLCFVAHSSYDFRFKTKKQKIINLGYFVPFKTDFIWKNQKSYKKWAKINDNTYDFYVTTSDLVARVISVDTGIYYNKFLSLGMPRNDMYYNEQSKLEIIEKVKENINIHFEKLIIYVPTYRDYECKIEDVHFNVLGYKNLNMSELQNILEENNAVLLIKLHPFQSKEINYQSEYPRIILYNTLSNTLSLYDYMNCADIMITDYTSTYFDFLTLNKPIIFNFYDYKEYAKKRGFTFEPMKHFCAGEIVDSYESLVSILLKKLKGEDSYRAQRMLLNNLFDKNQDSSSAHRIADYFLK